MSNTWTKETLQALTEEQWNALDASEKLKIKASYKTILSEE